MTLNSVSKILGQDQSRSTIPSAKLAVGLIRVLLKRAKPKRERTDRYGYYRLSGLVPGSYSLRILQDSWDIVERQIAIEDRHIFDVNFTDL